MIIIIHEKQVEIWDQNFTELSRWCDNSDICSLCENSRNSTIVLNIEFHLELHRSLYQMINFRSPSEPTRIQNLTITVISELWASFKISPVWFNWQDPLANLLHVFKYAGIRDLSTPYPHSPAPQKFLGPPFREK